MILKCFASVIDGKLYISLPIGDCKLNPEDQKIIDEIEEVIPSEVNQWSPSLSHRVFDSESVVVFRSTLKRSKEQEVKEC